MNAPSPWQCSYAQSGSTTVNHATSGIFLYVYGPRNGGDNMRMRYCEQLRDYLDGDKRPIWLNCLKESQKSEYVFEGEDGTSITINHLKLLVNYPARHPTFKEKLDATNEMIKIVDFLFPPKDESDNNLDRLKALEI